jgi:hypothetical protein
LSLSANAKAYENYCVAFSSFDHKLLRVLR